jgi:hypothetical protein
MMCVDPAKAGGFDGLEIQDASGAKIPFGCQKMGEMGAMADCTTDAKAACPSLPNPICGHVFLAGSDVATVCIQPCTP